MNSELKFFETSMSKHRKLFESMLTVLVLLDIILITWASLFHAINGEFYTLIVYYDLFVCLILIPDFCYRLWVSDDRKRFLLLNGIDILGMIPLVIAGPALSYSRYFRLFRVIKILALFKDDLPGIYRFFRETNLDYAVIILFFTLIFCSFTFYLIEAGVNPHVHSISDALWYAVIAITTVGFGDIAPVTTDGRIISVIIVVVGIVFVGFLTASISSWLIKRQKGTDTDKLDKLENVIMDMKSEIKNSKGTDTGKLDKLENVIMDMKSEIRDLKEIIEKQNK